MNKRTEERITAIVAGVVFALGTFVFTMLVVAAVIVLFRLVT
jgi:hypothetical protein